MIRKSIKNILGAGALIFTIQLGVAQSSDKVSESTLERLVTTKISMDKDGAFNDRYTIHIFQGENQQANAIKSRYDALGLNWKSELRYESPNHKVWVGKYGSRLEADRALLEIKKSFPNAKVLKP
ncbi:hypothetical protein SAMN05192588_2640 [Nonlabens sp. Hel1_33_55]|uniref:translation initiation factor IF-2 n=1 Tax=Nonlabens sp. Hel1_33_55 TaxID=1336802 RepID=UPI000875CB59|nr:translation initiation factor IF-2 [Nonlabens sp. Hel1_33_55]SCY39285.1 hypothetical protein SAMN05192588_2640 [Nonlabens sp. Hel1_33_55]